MQATVLDHAILASHIYHPTLSHYCNETFITLNRAEHLRDGWGRMNDVNPNIHPSQPFYCQLYLKFIASEPVAAVVAIRGTLPTNWDNDWVDLYSWFSDVLAIGGSDHVPAYLPAAIQFVERARQYLRQHFPALKTLSLTGHSLSGAVAQLIPLTALAIPVIAFNSPGCGHMPHIIKSRFPLSMNVNSRYGLINKIGLTVGQLFLVNVVEEQEAAKNLFAHFDKADYQKSIADFQQGENVAGFYERIKSLLSETTSILQLPEYQQHVLQCECQEDQNFWVKHAVLMQTYGAALCQSQAFWRTFGHIIAAQHAISNIITTLQLPANKQLATKQITR